MAPKQDGPLRGALSALEKAETCSEYSLCLSSLKTALSELHSAAKAAKMRPSALKKQSATWVPALIQVLKVALAQLSREALDTSSAQVLASAFEQGISGMEVFRSCLSGRPIELELHRHAVVCKLIAHQCYDLALQQSCSLLRVLSRQLTQTADGLPQGNSSHASFLCSLPAPPEGIDHDTAQLVTATCMNVLLCSAHAQEGDQAEMLCALVPLTEQLQPWLRCVPYL